MFGGSNVSLASRRCFGTLDVRDCLRLIVPSYFTVADAVTDANPGADTWGAVIIHHDSNAR
jgi:hypothetical protein